MTTKAKKGQTDAARFEGNGISYKAKLIGVEDVPEARGDQMCQETITKLKNEVKVAGSHKQKVFVNVTLEGLKIIDAVSFYNNQNKKKNEKSAKKTEEKESEEKDKESEESQKEEDTSVLHTHPVHRISFISRDTTDSRAFGYIYGDGDGSHKFFAIKTGAAAEQLVLALRDLFQVVYELKKKEVEDAKEKIEKGEVAAADGETLENSTTSGDGSTSGTGQTPQTQNVDGENIYQVPPNNAPVTDAANLLDLEDQAEHILKGIEQIKNLDFDSIHDDFTSSPMTPPTSPLAKLAAPPSQQSDPWGLNAAAAPAATTAPAAPSSALGDLAGLQTSPFPTMMGQPTFPQPGFPGTPYPAQGGFGQQPAFPQMGGGLPVARDPFGNDPFRMQGMQAPPAVQPPAYNHANPFGAQTFGAQAFGGQAFGAQQPRPGVPAMVVPGMMHGGVPQQGMMAHPQQGMMANPFAVQQQPQQMTNAFADPRANANPNANLLTPIRQDGKPGDAADQARPKSPKVDLFGDLLNIKTSTQTAATPKDMFAQLNAQEKKSINQLKTAQDFAAKQPLAPAQAPAQGSSPFGDPFTVPPPQQSNGNPSNSETLLD